MHNGDEIMKGVDLGICDHVFSLRIPEKLKKATDRLSAAEKKDLRNEILTAMAKVCHQSAFNPSYFLED